MPVWRPLLLNLGSNEMSKGLRHVPAYILAQVDWINWRVWLLSTLLFLKAYKAVNSADDLWLSLRLYFHNISHTLLQNFQILSRFWCFSKCLVFPGQSWDVSLVCTLYNEAILLWLCANQNQHFSYHSERTETTLYMGESPQRTVRHQKDQSQ